MDKPDILSLNLNELEKAAEELSEKKYRAKQVFEWLHKKGVQSFDEMSNIPQKFLTDLSEKYAIYSVQKVEIKESGDGTKKYLFRLHDGELIESVFMRYRHGNSVCISSQVGCRMGCKFCASTLDGLVRNLTAGEMLSQIYVIGADVKERISNVVIMGSGEPFDNYDNVVSFLRLINDKNGLNLSGRNITVSTCGLPDKIKQFANEGFSATLAISLHAPTDEKRKEIMPVANRYAIDEIMDACDYFFEKTGRRVSFEYSLIMGVNDSDDDVKKLSLLLSKRNCHVNLIPVNPVSECGFKSPSYKAALTFKNKLEKNNINVTIRREMGRDIDGACGQLRRRIMLTNG